jgi:hypothetical protein
MKLGKPTSLLMVARNSPPARRRFWTEDSANATGHVAALR